jgi:uncharacterized protein (DUF983 family)
VTNDRPRVSSLTAGWRCACPRCGEGKLYDGLLSVRERCAVCGLDFTGLTAEDGPAFFIIVGLSAIVLPLAVWFEFAVEPPLWLHIVIWIPVVVGGSVAVMRPLKAWIIAQQYRHRVNLEHEAG